MDIINIEKKIEDNILSYRLSLKTGEELFNVSALITDEDSEPIIVKSLSYANQAVVVRTHTEDGFRYTFVSVIDNKFYSIHSFNAFPDNIYFNESLRKLNKVIIYDMATHNYFIYNYEFGLVCSGSYNKIFYDEIENEFHVEEYVLVDDKIVTFFGTLDTEGNLVNGCLYSPYLQKEIYVDESNVASSINNEYNKINKLVRKKEKADLRTIK